jgi:hypothetical protein
MKAKNTNGTITTYPSVPKTHKNIINFHLLSDAELRSHGFYDVHTPDYNSATQEIGAIEWDSANTRFTYPVVDKTWSQTLAEMKEQKISNLKAIYNQKLSETDWMVVREAEGGTAVPSATATERTNLRTECATKEGEINALTTKAAVADYDMPSSL